MNSFTKNSITYAKLLLLVGLLSFPLSSLEAQRFGHGASRGGKNMSRPSGGRSVNGGFQRQPNRNFSSSRPSNMPSARPATRPSHNTNTRDISRPSNSKPKIDRGNANIKNNNNRDFSNSKVVNKPRTKNNVNINNNRNNININNRTNININNRHTVVVANPRPYRRPPYRYGGFGFYCYHPYYYHPFRPFYWGPIWHPWGFFVASLATTAIIVSIENDANEYYYDQGNYYNKVEDGYTVIQAPVGATIKVLPDGYEVVEQGGSGSTTNNYYYGGAYYEKTGDGYTVVPPTAGTIVENLPEGAEEVRVGDQTYVKYGETYYQPVQVDGKNMYEVAEVKEE
ncbi:DUF6515 family protein [Galbibacter mesophilus]|uniref:DUF6515 family protein n=1 Tax=Galbibacter mesophilus TaxID=379069 RepID=UPI00191ECEA8|nr:DUF6515 family protein [Galbibacter mesophilus]MCM5663724.1 DUF6515 family protein [Galbibacter mesophilus]